MSVKTTGLGYYAIKPDGPGAYERAVEAEPEPYRPADFLDAFDRYRDAPQLWIVYQQQQASAESLARYSGSYAQVQAPFSHIGAAVLSRYF